MMGPSYNIANSVQYATAAKSLLLRRRLAARCDVNVEHRLKKAVI